MLLLDIQTNAHDELTERETIILDLMHQGLQRDDIATRLELTASTISTHIYNICRKLNVTSQKDALIKAQHCNLLN